MEAARLLSAEDKDLELSEADRGALATEVMLAALICPPSARYGEEEDFFASENEGNLRLASLLGFKKETPTRSRLLQQLAEYKVCARTRTHTRTHMHTHTRTQQRPSNLDIM